MRKIDGSDFKSRKSKIEQVLNGAVDEALIKRMSKELKLDDAKLIRSVCKEWAPVPVVVNGSKISHHLAKCS